MLMKDDCLNPKGVWVMEVMSTELQQTGEGREAVKTLEAFFLSGTCWLYFKGLARSTSAMVVAWKQCRKRC
jgi:hypothetical protein